MLQQHPNQTQADAQLKKQEELPEAVKKYGLVKREKKYLNAFLAECSIHFWQFYPVLSSLGQKDLLL